MNKVVENLKRELQVAEIINRAKEKKENPLSKWMRDWNRRRYEKF